ncbi:MAG: AAA family ATPase, partial [Gammaproteobacteria bacterium]
ESSGVPIRILDIDADLAVLRDRITRRLGADNDPSEANLEVLEGQVQNRDPLNDSERQSTIQISTAQEIDANALVEQLNRCRNC